MSNKSDKSSESQGNNKTNLKGEKLTPKGRRFLKLWIIGIILIFLFVGSYMVGVVYEDKQSDIAKHVERMSPNLNEPGLTPAEQNLSTNSNITKVVTGIYVDQIRDFSLSDSTWTVDFYIWFKWNGSNVNPGENLQIIDGNIIDKKIKDNYTRGTEHYEIYYVTAEISKFFDVLRFPVDNHVLTIGIEDEQNERPNLIYVPENDTSEISSRVQIPGYSISNITVIEKPHTYKSNFGDPRLENGSTTFSQFRAGIDVSRPDLGFYFRIFIALFVAVTAALLALLIKPTEVDPRFVLGSGALFVAVANNIITSELIPKTGVLTLADMVNDLGLILILITLVESTISLYLYDKKGEKKLSRVMDKISIVLLLVIYIVINIAIVVAAW
ncbi:MAG: hypothetical protein HZC47_01850 [Methanobacterium sp.]|uniref:hypothetical protein n=1 Tax=Methanobacterium sp. TaxID=2164 RepID=UPI003D646343|nr:hypothetical protein [Methanobacterium sp.]